MNQMPHVDFLFDFGSPNAYLCHAVIPALEKRTGITVRYVPILLGGVFKATNNTSPGVAFKDVKNKLDYMQLETKRFIAAHGITGYRRNPYFPVNTLQIMRGAIAAELDGIFATYVDAVFKAMWEQEKKMDEADVIASVLDEAGLDGQHILTRIQDPEIKSQLVQNTNGAVERGVFGAPTFFVNEEMFFGKDTLGDVEREIEKATNSDQ